jgi:hypothetical protein
MTKYPYWGYYENYFSPENVKNESKNEKMQLSGEFKPVSGIKLDHYVTHYRIAKEDGVRYKIKAKVVDSNVSKIFICTKQGGAPVSFTS